MKIASLIGLAIAFIPLIPSTTYYERVEDPPIKEEVQQAPAIKDVKIVLAKVSAYTSDPAETDSTPDITASGAKTRYGVVANNCLAFGTEVTIDGRVYVVEDRMNRRHGCEKFDVWMGEKESAIQWGIRELPVSIER